MDCSFCYNLRHDDVETLHFHRGGADRLRQCLSVIVEDYRSCGIEHVAGSRYDAEAGLCLIAVAELYGESLAAECILYELRSLDNRFLHEVAGIRKVHHEPYIAHDALVGALEVNDRAECQILSVDDAALV